MDTANPKADIILSSKILELCLNDKKPVTLIFSNPQLTLIGEVTSYKKLTSGGFFFKKKVIGFEAKIAIEAHVENEKHFIQKPLTVLIELSNKLYKAHASVAMMDTNPNDGHELTINIDPRFMARSRRVYTRFKNPMSQSEKQVPYWIKNLSIDGLGIVSTEPTFLSTKHTFQAHLSIPNFHEKSGPRPTIELRQETTFLVTLTVQNKRKLVNGDYLGCHFMNIQGPDLSTIQKFIIILKKHPKSPALTGIKIISIYT